MSKNRVKERCQKEEIAKFYYTAQRMFRDLKASRGFLYIVAIIPVVLAFIPATVTLALILSLVSFGLSLLNEGLSTFLNEYKKKAIMELQLYETGITGSDFAKIEYDRETTNELNELAIRKGLPQMREREKLNEVFVPEDISDDYSYIYLCRKSAATTKYLLSRIFYIYFISLIAIAAGFVLAFAIFAINGGEATVYLTLLITSYPIVSPIIKACGKCKECMKDCTKMCADIDNFFADGDISVERLARMYYYVQTLEFEMMANRPAIYGLYAKIFKKGTDDLEEGVTFRFKEAIVELKGKSMMQKGMLAPPKGKALITKVDYNMDMLTKIERDSRSRTKSAKKNADSSAKPEPKEPGKKSVASTKSKKIQPKKKQGKVNSDK